jgi:uncharacterized membrane protein
MVANSWWLLLFCLTGLCFFFRKKKYYLSHAYSKSLSKSGNKKVILCKLLFWLGWVSLVIACINPYVSYMQSTKVLLVHRYILM